MHTRLLQRLVKGSMRFFDSVPIDRVLSRFSIDTTAIGESSRWFFACCATV
jgi:hypothetical protein